MGRFSSPSQRPYIGFLEDIKSPSSQSSSTTKVWTYPESSPNGIYAEHYSTGWNAPKRSALLVHPDGYTAHATNDELCIEFDPSPDYAGIAKAASGGVIWAGKATKVEELDALLKEAVEAVEGGVSAVLEVVVFGTGV